MRVCVYLFVLTTFQTVSGLSLSFEVEVMAYLCGWDDDDDCVLSHVQSTSHCFIKTSIRLLPPQPLFEPF